MKGYPGMERIAPPHRDKAFSVETAYLRAVLKMYRTYDQMEASEKRAFLWQLGTWHIYRERISSHRIPPDMMKYPFHDLVKHIDQLIADMLAEKAGLEVRPSIASRLPMFDEGWISKLEAVEEEQRVWY